MLIQGFKGLTRHPGPALDYPILSRIIDAAAAAYVRLNLWQRRRQSRQVLAALDPHQLRDIGISHADIAGWSGRLSAGLGRPANADDLCRRALASLPDDRLCDLSESGRRIRRQARQEFHRA
jgi:uncharacterized protein YjiS (DUF1127 family)